MAGVSVQGEDVDIAAELENLEKETPDEPESKPETKDEPEEKVRYDDKLQAEVIEKGPEKLVRLAALHEAREQNRQLKAEREREVRENAEFRAKMEARLNALANPAPQQPDYNADPAGHLKYETDQLRQELGQTREQQAKANEAKQRADVELQVKNRLALSEQEFAKTHPDYQDAAKHLGAVINKNLSVMGITDPAARAAAFDQQVIQITANAIRNGQDPAEVAYALAQNAGYTTTVKKAEAKVDQITKGQEASKTLGSGGKSDTVLSLAALEKMDDDEFAELVADPKKWKRIGKMF